MVNFIYPNSKRRHGDSNYCIVATDKGDKLSVTGHDASLFEEAETFGVNGEQKFFPLSVENSRTIMKLFDFTRPKSHKGYDVTIGLGDRLGLATAGHIRSIRDYDIYPVFAQQSMRELHLTNRTYDDVIASAVWAVFREGYLKGYGADGDHLKTRIEVKYALGCGCTMITLDCSEHIPNGLEAVVKFTTDIYNEFIRGKDIDFELSIDETQTPTTPEDHLFVAEALKAADVEITSLAPRFCGEFQKGIDYIGDVELFEKEYKLHAEIAERYGYKISVHSGSDKFSVFPIVGSLSGGRYHVKTAGTNWLEAVRVIAEKAPDLYREMHAFALENLSEARQLYHITCDLSNIAPLSDVSDEELPLYLDKNDSRQILHITYGVILQAKTNTGTPRFYDRIYRVLGEYEADYIVALEKHIGKHLTGLGVNIRK